MQEKKPQEQLERREEQRDVCIPISATNAGNVSQKRGQLVEHSRTKGQIKGRIYLSDTARNVVDLRSAEKSVRQPKTRSLTTLKARVLKANSLRSLRQPVVGLLCFA